jgi:hypothetical protein
MASHPFAALPQTSGVHFKLYFYAAVVHLIEHVTRPLGSLTTTFERFPFLGGYYDELAHHGLPALTRETAIDWWRDALHAWEAMTQAHLPLRALRETAGFNHEALTMLLSIGTVEEDVRFGDLFETIQGLPGQRRPTVGLLNAWWDSTAEPGDVRMALRRLQELGLVQALNHEVPRAERSLQVPEVLWETLRGDGTEQLAPWARHYQVASLPILDDLILPELLRRQLMQLPTLLAEGDVRVLIVRGPRHNGRHTTLATVARLLGRGVLAVDGLHKADDERWRLVGPLATMLHAMPVVALDLAPGETASLPGFPGYNGPVGLILGKQGGVSGPGAERALSLTLEMPDAAARCQHWRVGFAAHVVRDLEAIGERLRLTSGNIRRAAPLAVSYAALDQRTTITLADVQQASRTLNRQALDSLATRVRISGDWSQLAVNGLTQAELHQLEHRCRHRERLPASVGAALGPQLNVGVRALFSGPSGTGKTLAARVLASVLQMDLYRLDLSAVVNKYIGETEKSLNQILSQAEERDVILLLDEGDALLTQRTSVQTSNDRYANLETNYLLQRLEAYEGILIVTTNAGERIDSAFQRRLDVVVHFLPPEAPERWVIWNLHLPAKHAVDAALLREIAGRCALSGGQIRNAVLHASLLALNDGGIVTSDYLEAAVQREYRKAGSVCPLRRGTALSRARE